MKVEIWSDVVCPWCYIGKRRFEAALARFAHRDEVEVTWRAFELDPAAPRGREGELADHLATKYGVSREQAQAMHDSMTERAAAEGLIFRFDRARSGNTFDAHRLLHLAADRGVQGAVKERLMSGYLIDGEAIGDPEALARLAAEAGLDPDEARAVLAGDGFAAEVRADEAQAQAFGVTGVPFFVVDRRYGVAGAQPAEVLLEVLGKAWADEHPLSLVAVGDEAAGACDDGSCAV
ncbi:MAG: disulfide bond formation protein DsbA [Pseudonocardiales bacterium]|nr:MAG: disulfide bond formation protein DsbA [Pseudonocardiales bacterium]